MRYVAHPIDDDGWTEWIQPRRGYKMRCCDCRLVHELEFRVRGSRVQYRARRHERATAASRRVDK
jgi:Zn-finger protein